MSDMETSRKKRKLTTKQGVVIGVATVAGLGLLTKLFSFLRRDKEPKNLSDAELETLEAVLSGDAASSPVSAQAEIVRSTPKFANLESDENDEESKPVQELSTDATIPETEASKSLEVPHFNGDLHSNGDAVIAKSTPTEDEDSHLDNSTELPSQTKEALIEVAEKLPTEDLEKLPAESIEKLPISDVEKAPEDHVEANGNSVQAHIEDVAEKLATDEPQPAAEPSDHDAEELSINHVELKPQQSENESVLFEINHAEVKPQSKEDDAEVKVESREIDAEVKPQASEHDAEVKPQDAEELVINHVEEKPQSTKHEEQSREEDDAVNGAEVQSREEEDDAEHVKSSYKIVSAEEPEILTKAGLVSVEDAGNHETEASSVDQL